MSDAAAPQGGPPAGGGGEAEILAVSDDRREKLERLRSEGIDPLLAETVELGAPVVGQRSIFVILSLR